MGSMTYIQDYLHYLHTSFSPADHGKCSTDAGSPTKAGLVPDQELISASLIVASMQNGHLY
jgi:hypothetical protein